MAGSGKTTMIKALWKYFSQPRVLDSQVTEEDTVTQVQSAYKTYILNLDPAVGHCDALNALTSVSFLGHFHTLSSQYR
jgi:thymidylate kinase